MQRFFTINVEKIMENQVIFSDIFNEQNEPMSTRYEKSIV